MFKAGLVVLALMSVGFNATAEELYKCQITATAKRTSDLKDYVWTRNAFLSKQRYATVEFYGDLRTQLDLIVESNGDLQGFVNEQYGFVLKGNVKAGEFESAFAKGMIQCEPAQDYKVAYVFLSRNEISVFGETHTIFPLRNGNSLQNSCYIGDTQLALEQVRAALNVDAVRSGIGSDKSINVTLDERKCLEWIGHIGDYECTKWDVVRPVTYSLKSCDQEGDRQ